MPNGKIHQFSIAAPCHQNWQHMTPTIRGRHCAECQKEVIDFTHMTDAEVIRYTAQHANTQLCGRFKLDQIDRPMADFGLKPAIWWQKILLSAALATSVVYGAKAQIAEDVIIKSIEDKYNQIQMPARTFTLSCMLQDVSGIPIEGIEVIITDVSGKIITGSKSGILGKTTLHFTSADTNFYVITAGNADTSRIKLFFPNDKHTAILTAKIDTSHALRTRFEVLFINAKPEQQVQQKEIRGFVVGIDQKKVAGASVSLIDTTTDSVTQTTLTAHDGSFCFSLPDDYVGDSLSFRSYLNGFYGEATSSISQIDSVIVPLNLDVLRLLQSRVGMISYTPPTRWQRFRGFLTRLFRPQKKATVTGRYL